MQEDHEANAIAAFLEPALCVRSGAQGERRGRPKLTDAQRAATAAAVAKASDDYSALDDQLFNDNAITPDGTGVTLQREQPHHRLMVSLRARGYNAREIAEMTGYTAVTVGYVLRQPWARTLMLTLLKKDDQVLAEVLRAECMPSIETLVEIRDDGEANRRERLAASNALLDRFLGRPTQRTEIAEVEMPSDLDALERETQAVRAESARLLGRLN